MTAAALIIGDEILTGKVRDENTYVLAQMLFEQGVRLQRVVTVRDEIDTIVQQVRHLSETYQFVFTSGGIGPTHDDKTYEAIAKAFNRTLVYNEKMLANLERYCASLTPPKVLNNARKRMALFPTPCEVIYTPGLGVPLVVVENVYVLPGIPELFAQMIWAAKDRFVGQKQVRVLVYTQESESDFAEALAAVQQNYPDVQIGSYPKSGHLDYRVMISLEGVDAALVSQAVLQVCTAVNGFLGK